MGKKSLFVSADTSKIADFETCFADFASQSTEFVTKKRRNSFYGISADDVVMCGNTYSSDSRIQAVTL